MRAGDRRAVLVSGGARMPRPSRGAAAQRIDGQTELVARPEGIVGPAVPGEAVRAVAFEVPYDRVRILVPYLQANERVRAGEQEFPDGPHQLDRVGLVEDRNGVVGGGSDRHGRR